MRGHRSIGGVPNALDLTRIFDHPQLGQRRLYVVDARARRKCVRAMRPLDKIRSGVLLPALGHIEIDRRPAGGQQLRHFF